LKKIIAMIPARMASTRYPGKPIIDICGKTMIEHVWQRVKLNKNIDSVYIATCDEAIKKAGKKFGADVVMTSDKHVRCTDRISEGCKNIIKKGYDFDIVINVQGDEPLLKPDVLDLLIKPLIKEDSSVANLIEELKDENEINYYNNVKAIFDTQYNALYFSRLPIPTGLGNNHYKQLGIYGLTREMAIKYPQMNQTPLEIAESDDMLRFVENGISVKLVISPYKTIGVDTPEDHKIVEELMEKDEIFKKYK